MGFGSGGNQEPDIQPSDSSTWKVIDKEIDFIDVL